LLIVPNPDLFTLLWWESYKRCGYRIGINLSITGFRCRVQGHTTISEHIDAVDPIGPGVSGPGYGSVIRSPPEKNADFWILYFWW